MNYLLFFSRFKEGILADFYALCMRLWSLPVLTALSGYLFILSLPFGYRMLLVHFTPGFDEYESVFLYANDILLAFFLVASTLFFIKNKPRFSFARSRALALRSALMLFAGLALASVLFASLKPLALYAAVRLFTAIGMALALAYLLRRGILHLHRVLGLIAGLAVSEAIIAFLQFVLQRSLGLKYLGESLLGPQVPGTSKFFVGNGELIRAYGTFPHPNILGAFLLLGLFSLCYFWLRRPAHHPIEIDRQRARLATSGRPSPRKIWAGASVIWSDFVIALGIFVVLLGIAVTFSRATWLLAAFFSVLPLIYVLVVPSGYRIQAFRLLILLFFLGLFTLLILAPFIVPRAAISPAEPAVAYRIAYNEMGIDLALRNWWGVGIGNQVYFSVREGWYERFGMPVPWMWQPIHNIYLLMASEIGILGLLAFLGLVLFLVFLKRGPQTSDVPNIGAPIFPGHRMSKYWDLCFGLEYIIPKLMLLSLLLFGLVDHFLWTLEPGRLMLWLAVGLVLGINSRQEREPS